MVKVPPFANLQTVTSHFMGTLQNIKYSISTRNISTIVLTVGLLTVYFLPTEFLFNSSQTFCIHKKLLHFDCPGCGMTRALYSFMHFRFYDAVNFNFGVFTLVPLLTTEIVLSLRFNNSLINFRNLFYLLLCLSLIIIYIERIYKHFYNL